MTGWRLQIKPWAADDALWLVLLGGVCLFAAARAFRGTWPRPYLAARLSLAVLVAFVFLQPAAERRVLRRDAPVAVVVDRSTSMASVEGSPGRGGGRSRWEAAVARLGEEAAFLEENASPAWFVLDQYLRRVSLEELRGESPRGAASDFSLLERIPEELPGVRSVFFFSDGRAGGGGDAAAAARLGLPLYAVGTGTEAEGPDLMVDDLRAPRFAFKGTEAEVSVRAAGRGVGAGPFTVRLTQGRETLSAAEVSLPAAGGTAEAVLKFRPLRTGPQTFHVRLPLLEGETNEANNARSFTLDVSRDRVRVLYICGRPGPNYAFLRHQIKSDPAMELVSFVILRDPEDLVNVPDHQLALIPFPSQKALLEQLPSFDAVILEQFSLAQFGIAQEGMAALRKYVERGGGLLFMGDAWLWSAGGPYARTVLDSLLPLGGDGPPRPGPVRFAFEPWDADHPVTRLEDDPAGSAAVWKSLEPLEGDGFFPPPARAGGSLAGAGGPAAGRPVLAATPWGRGRVMALANLTTWRWAMSESGKGRGTRVYQTFWGNVLRWLSGSDDFRLVRLELPAEPAAPWEAMMLRVRVRDDGHRPLSQALVRARVAGPGGREWRRELRSLGPGEYGEEFTPGEPGTHRISIEAYHKGRLLGKDEGLLKAGSSWDESLDTRTDFGLLERLSAAAGGAFTPLDGADRAWFRERLASASLSSDKRRALWHSPWVLALLTGGLFAEWIWRRRRGAP